MHRIFFFIIFAFAGVLFFFSCKKTEMPAYPAPNDYYPLRIGASFTYRVDSTVLAPFGSALLVVSHDLKDSIVSTFNDDAGRLSYLVYRFITDTLQTQPWQYISTYFITPTSTDIEVVDENNFRFIKLVTPIAAGRSWLGNAYIDTKSVNSNVQYLDGWNYTYENVNMPDTVQRGIIDSTVTVLQQDESTPGDFSTSDLYYEKNYSVEVYGKGIGLIYKDFLHWTWNQNPEPAYSDDSYGIRLSLISYH
jgi:hypothetical protein